MRYSRPGRAALLALLAAACTIASPAPEDAVDDQARPRPNLRLPTLGGIQMWGDVRWQDGWRIQQHVFTGHHRLLDPARVRRAWGNYAACSEVLDRQLEAAPPPAPARGLVVLLHGMGRSTAAFARMQDRLVADGWAVACVGYPSTRRSISDHVEQVETLLGRVRGYQEVHFVTHSLGGIVLRHVLARDGAWRARLTPGRAVTLAPPHQGSRLAASLSRFPPFRWAFGDTGAGLTPAAMRDAPLLEIEFLVIAGCRGDGRGWNPWLEGDDDGIVRVEETRLEGAAAHHTVRAIHTFLMMHPEVIAQTAAFLARGPVTTTPPRATQPPAR